jgi:hypothetical protein
MFFGLQATGYSLQTRLAQASERAAPQAGPVACNLLTRGRIDRGCANL